MTDEATFDPWEPGFAEDPYPQYARLRARGPAVPTEYGVLLVTSYADAFAVLRAPGTSVDERNATVDLIGPVPTADEGRTSRGRRSILRLDPPDHTRLRRLVSGAFTVRRAEALRPRVRRLVAELLDDLAAAAAAGGDTDDGAVDVIGRFAFPLPFTVIHELLGMPDGGDRAELRRWSQVLTRSLEPIGSLWDDPEFVAASDGMSAFLLDAIAWKRRNPGDDLLSALIAIEDDGDRLSGAELLDQVRLLYLAGHETTVNLIGNGTFALLRHRKELERLVGDPSLDGNAVDELLRYDSPVQLSRRIALTRIEVEGHVAHAGDTVVTLLGCANRDEAKWGPTAGQLDLGRPGAGAHLSFGSGIHHCLGAALARIEGAEAVPALVRRFPGLELATDSPAWNGRLVLRGLTSLPLHLGPAA
jgi:cytochrome P450